MTWTPDKPWTPGSSEYDLDARMQRLIEALERTAVLFAELARQADEAAESLRREMEAE